MAESVITYLLSNPKNRVHVGSNNLAESMKIAEKKGLDRCTYSEINVSDSAALKSLIYTSDIIISYVPTNFHVPVAKACLEVGRNLVTASYITSDMMALDAEAKKKGLIFLNELGLDPGIDHMTTMKTIEEVREKGGRIVEY
jgi:saccharopine dehydrogenase-like NADP-dependent oxidoreductase